MTSEQEHEQAIIPPYFLLIIALVGFIVTLYSLLQPTFTVVGWGGLGITILSLLAWVLMAPEQAKALLSGRAARFGGTSILITVIFIIMLMAIYGFVRDQNLRVDLTERDDFSLTAAARDAIAALGGDPTLSEVHLLVFYPAGMAANQDSDSLLFEDYAQTSGGKISYQIVDPDRNPQLANQVGYQQPGQIYVTKYLEAEGDADPVLDLENGTMVNFYSPLLENPQDSLTSAIVETSITGDVRGYVLSLEGGLSLSGGELQGDGLQVLNSIMSDRLGWTLQEVSGFELLAPESEIELNDPAADGEVLLIPGGSAPMLPEELALVQDYLDQGGHVVLLASGRGSADSPDMAADPALNSYLSENFGLSFNDDLVIDLTQSYQTFLRPVVSDFQPHPITNDTNAQSNLFTFMPHSITMAELPPDNVTVSPLVMSGPNAYSKSNFDEIFAFLNGDSELEDSIRQSDDDPTGPLLMAAAAENSQTGARLVLIGSDAIASDGMATIGSNALITVNSLTWAASFELNDFITRTSVQSAQSATDTPIAVDESTIGVLNLITLILLPFGILGIGLLVWWNNREAAH